MDYSALLIKITIFIVLLAVGYAGARKGILGGDFSKSASSLLINVFISASILNSVIGERPAISQAEFRRAMLALFILIAAMYAVSALFSLAVKDKKAAPQTELAMSVVNNLFIGMPIAQSLFGGEAVFYMGISCVPYNILLYTYMVWRLQGNKGSKSVNLKNIISAPLIAAVAALAVFILNPPVPRVVKELLGTVSAATLPMSMIIIGATLGKTALSSAFKDKRVWLAALVRLIITPAVLYFILAPMNLSRTLLVTSLIIAGCPSGAIVTPLSIQYGYDPEYSSRIVMVTTVVSMVTLPLMIRILMQVI